jgi:hypothetical protein
MTRIAVPALIVMLAVAAFVGAAGWNTSGPPRLVVTLTERELQMPYTSVPPGEEPGVLLRMSYEPRFDPLDSRNWLPESRLRELGFPLHVPAGSPQAIDAYDHVPARLAWVAFEYDGPQWREIERRRLLRAAETPSPRVERLWSRLVPVDAAADFDVLRTRYPIGHLIMRAVIGVSYVRSDPGGPLLHGRLREVVPQSVAVPYQFRSLFAGLTSASQGGVAEPRYEVDLAIGRLGLPFVQAVRLRR